jgi:trans-aconitate methyltransferase
LDSIISTGSKPALDTMPSQMLRHNLAKTGGNYDYHAVIQQQIIQKLVRKLQHIALPFTPRILEIGAATGNLSARLQELWPHAHFTLTDASPEALRLAKQRLNPKCQSVFKVVELADLPPEGHFDLIVSSMVLHWLPDAVMMLRKIIAALPPGGIFAFALLGQGSFDNWRRACHMAQVDCGLWDYPTAAQLRELPGVMVVQERMQSFFESAEDFLLHLKAIDALAARPGYRPRSIGDLARTIEAANTIRPFVINYEILFGACHTTAGLADLPPQPLLL